MAESERHETRSAAGGRGYDAFLCYSHTKDRVLAQALQAAIEGLVRPFPFVRRLRVFRDETDLEATPHLWGSIQRELARSRYLILLASPAAVASPWVPKELEEFFSRASVEQVLVVLTEGTAAFHSPGQGERAIPALLESGFQRAGAEPLVLDLRELRGLGPDEVRKSPKLEEVAARLAARLLELPLTKLWGAHRQLQRRWSLISGAAAAVLLATLAVAGWNELEKRSVLRTNASLREETRQLTAQRELLARDKAALEMDKARLAEENRLSLSDLESLRQRLSNTNSELKRAQAGLEDLKGTNRQLQARVTASRQQFEQLNAAIFQGKKEVATLEARLEGATRQMGSAARVAAGAPGMGEGALVAAIEAAGSYLEKKRPLPVEVREGLVAGIAAAANVRVLGQRDEHAKVIALCPQWGMALTRHPKQGLASWSLSTGASRVLRADDTGWEGTAGGSCAASARNAVLHGGSLLHPWVETWDIARGRRIARMEDELWSFVSDSALSPDGQVAAAVLLDGMVYVWDASTGRRLRRFRQPERTGVRLTFSPAGDLLLVDGGAKQVTVWDYRTGTVRSTLKGGLGLDSHAPGQWSPDGREVLLLTDSQHITVARLDGAGAQSLPERTAGLWQAGFDPEARRVLAASSDGTAAIIERATGLDRVRLTGHGDAVLAAAFSQDGRYVATVGRDHTLRLWDAATGEALKDFWHVDPLEPFVAFTSDKSALVTRTETGTVHVWSIRSGLFVGARNGSCRPASGQDVSTVVPEPGRYALVLCKHANTLHLVDVATGREEDVFEWDFITDVNDAAISQDGRHVLLGLVLGRAAWFDRDTRRWSSARVASMAKVLRVAWDASGRRFAFALPRLSSENVVGIWDIELGGEVVNRFQVSGMVTGLLFSKEGRHLLVGAETGAASVWAFSREGEAVKAGELEAGKPAAKDQSVRFVSESGLSTIYALTRWGQYREWNTETGAARDFGSTELMRLSLLPSQPRFQLHYDSETQKLIVGDVATGIPLVQLAPAPAVEGVTGKKRSMSAWPSLAYIAEEGRALLVQGRDGWLRKWMLPEPMPQEDEALVSLACERLSSVARGQSPRACAERRLMAEHR